MDQSTEPVATAEVKLGRCRDGWEWPKCCCLVQRAVGAMVVEMGHVLGEYRFEVAAVEDQYPVEQFSADGTDPSFGDRVRSGRSYGCAQDADAFAGEHGVEHAGELAVAPRSRINNVNSAARAPSTC